MNLENKMKMNELITKMASKDVNSDVLAQVCLIANGIVEPKDVGLDINTLLKTFNIK